MASVCQWQSVRQCWGCAAAQVLNPQGRVIHSVKDQTAAKFSFKTQYVGHYQFCLSLSAHLATAVLKHGPR